jgi:hypothetical protein
VVPESTEHRTRQNVRVRPERSMAQGRRPTGERT